MARQWSIFPATLLLVCLAAIGLLLISVSKAMPSPASPNILPRLPDIGIGSTGGFESIPLSGHALDGHLIERWNARNLPRVMNVCFPRLVFYCPDGENSPQLRVFCPVGGDLWAGLIIGLKDPRGPMVVTGFAARSNYWAPKLVQDSCFQVNLGW